MHHSSDPIRLNFRWRSHHRKLLSLLLGMGFCALVIALNLPAIAQTSSVRQARVTEIVDGSQVFIQSNPARLNDLANRGQRVSTGNARAQLTFDTGAIARLSQNSVLTVGQCAQLQRGILLVNGAANGCTASVTAGVRGTTYLIEVDDSGQEQITVLEGEVVIAKRDASSEAIETETESPDQSIPAPTPAIPTQTVPSSDDGETSDQVTLTAGQKVGVSPEGELAPVEQLSADDFIAILSGTLFDGFTTQLPGVSKIQEAFQQLFPGIPFPLRLPGVSVPGLPIPRVPRFPF